MRESVGALAAIDAALEDWEHDPDAVRCPPGLPVLDATQKTAVADLCARTGMDGYTATLIVADVAAYGDLSPYREVAGPRPLPQMVGWIRVVSITDRNPVAVRPFTISMQQLGEDIQELGNALRRALPAFAAGVDDLDTYPDGALADPASWRPCERASRRDPKPLCIDGKEYTRRQKARQRRRR